MWNEKALVSMNGSYTGILAVGKTDEIRLKRRLVGKDMSERAPYLLDGLKEISLSGLSSEDRYALSTEKIVRTCFLTSMSNIAIE